MNARKRILAWLALLLMAAIVLAARIAEPFDLALLAARPDIGGAAARARNEGYQASLARDRAFTGGSKP